MTVWFCGGWGLISFFDGLEGMIRRAYGHIHTRSRPHLRAFKTSLVPSPQRLRRGLLQGLLGASQGLLATTRTVCKALQQLPSLEPASSYGDAQAGREALLPFLLKSSPNDF